RWACRCPRRSAPCSPTRACQEAGSPAADTAAEASDRPDATRGFRPEPGVGRNPAGYTRPVKVVVHDRTGVLPAQLRSYAERKLERLSRHFDRVVEAEIEFDLERRKSQDPAHRAQIWVRTDGRRHRLAHARERADTFRAAVDLA